MFKAQSPAGLAEEYLIKSIWSHRYAPGSILPSERELSEVIGVTRTTLREVLQRLARDGWLTIQHGKPTKVNNFWETSSLNILETLAKLEREKLPQLIEQLFSARLNICLIFIKTAFKKNPQLILDTLEERRYIPQDNSSEFVNYDYRVFQSLALASGNPIYALIFNGFKALYLRVGSYYFSDARAKDLALDFYQELEKTFIGEKVELVRFKIKRYGKASSKLWNVMRDELNSKILI